jgi:hypothetical protein
MYRRLNDIRPKLAELGFYLLISGSRLFCFSSPKRFREFAVIRCLRGHSVMCESGLVFFCREPGPQNREAVMSEY